jgi:hypothetical protein
MEGLFDISAAAIGFLFFTSIIIFVYSIVGKWKMIFKIYFGFAAVMLSHILLFYFVIFGGEIPLPAVLTKYSLGALNLLAKLIHV